MKRKINIKKIEEEYEYNKLFLSETSNNYFKRKIYHQIYKDIITENIYDVVINHITFYEYFDIKIELTNYINCIGKFFGRNIYVIKDLNIIDVDEYLIFKHNELKSFIRKEKIKRIVQKKS